MGCHTSVISPDALGVVRNLGGQDPKELRELHSLSSAVRLGDVTSAFPRPVRLSDESDCRGRARLTLRRACSCGSPVRSLTAGARRTTHAEGSMLAVPEGGKAHEAVPVLR